MAMMVVWFSAAVTSIVSPPDSSCFCFSGSFVVRSGLMIVQLSPRSADLWRNWLP